MEIQIHNLKTIQPYFDQVKSGEKTFEIRKDDRDYVEGDLLNLQEYDPKKNVYSGETVRKEITHILRDTPEFGLMPGYCIISFTSI